jgi:outer membrane lipoprotein SlyB
MHSLARLGSVALAAVMIAGCATRHSVAPAPAPQQYGNAGYGNSGYDSGRGGYNAGYYGHQGQQQQQQMWYGRVQSIEPIRAESRTSGGGALIGGAIGALAGHQVDHGNRKAAATVVGAVAGALIGNQIEKNNAGAQDVYRVSIRLDSGEVRSYDYAQLNDLRVGERVRVDAGNQVYRN